MENNTIELVSKYGFRFTKSLGQNFLVDDTVVRDIVSGSNITKDDHVIEIGPGVGTLTKELLKHAGKVTAIEIDKELIPILKKEFSEYDNFELIHEDVLKVDLNEITGGKKFKIVANLPYYVTTPILVKLLTSNIDYESITIMIQKEVALRLNAKPDNKDYGALTILVQYYTDTEIIRVVKPESFVPRPKVDSIVIKLNKIADRPIKPNNEELFFEVARQSFAMRRKTLSNTLKPLGFSKEALNSALERAGIDPKRRGETLSLMEFKNLSDELDKEKR